MRLLSSVPFLFWCTISLLAQSKRMISLTGSKVPEKGQQVKTRATDTRGRRNIDQLTIHLVCYKNVITRNVPHNHMRIMEWPVGK